MTSWIDQQRRWERLVRERDEARADLDAARREIAALRERLASVCAHRAYLDQSLRVATHTEHREAA